MSRGGNASSGSVAEAMRELAAGAMLGTDRLGSGRPGELLTKAAVHGLRSRAGWKPGYGDRGVLPVCPADPLPAASAAAMSTLSRLLGAASPDADLINEWAALARGRGVRIADSAAPLVLNWWSRQPHKSEDVFAVTGARGEWLASLNPAWRTPVAGAAIPANADELWQTGRGAERTAVLATVRRDDPGRALEMVRSTWGSDGADERRRFIEALEVNLSMADEEFLEAARDDKSKLVKRAAAAALGRLPGSRLRGRMTERARGMIVVEGGKRGLQRKQNVKVTLDPPKKFDAAWERDGVEEAAATGTGKRAYWMQQILAGAELSVWTETTGLDPEGVVAAVSEDDFGKRAIAAMAAGAEVAGDVRWSLAVGRAVMRWKEAERIPVSGLWRNLGDADREAVILGLTELDTLSPLERWSLLASNERAWSLSLSKRVLGVLKANPPRRAPGNWVYTGAADAISRRVAPEAEVEFEEAVRSAAEDDLSESYQRSLDRVRLRAQMHKEFAS